MAIYQNKQDENSDTKIKTPDSFSAKWGSILPFNFMFRLFL